MMERRATAVVVRHSNICTSTMITSYASKCGCVYNSMYGITELNVKREWSSYEYDVYHYIELGWTVRRRAVPVKLRLIALRHDYYNMYQYATTICNTSSYQNPPLIRYCSKYAYMPPSLNIVFNTPPPLKMYANTKYQVPK